MNATAATPLAEGDAGVRPPVLRLFVFALFFIFGGITSLNDVIIPKLKALFTLSYGEVMLVQSAFFAAYFLISIPASSIVRCTDGACVVPPLSAGKYSVLVCDAEGSIVPTDIKLDYAVVSPRDHTSGQSSGKRVHSDITISKRTVAGDKPGNQITIDVAGSQLAIGISDDAVEAARAKITKSRSNIQNN